MAGKKYVVGTSESRKSSLIQKILPTQFSLDEDQEFSNIGPENNSETVNIKLNVYKLKDSSLGLYHTGVEFGDLEYTFCHGMGIAYHRPKKCHFATLLGSKNLGHTEISKDSFQNILKDMNQYGSFSYSDYDVMDRSCNTFTYELSKRLHLSEKYPVGILNQSKMGELLAPVVHAIDILAWSSGFTNTNKRYLGYQTESETPANTPANTPSCIRKSLDKPELERQNSTWSLNWSIASNSKEKDQWPLAIARTSMKIINLFTIPHRIKYQKNAEEENCKKAADQSPIEDIKVDDSKFSTTKV